MGRLSVDGRSSLPVASSSSLPTRRFNTGSSDCGNGSSSSGSAVGSASIEERAFLPVPLPPASGPEFASSHGGSTRGSLRSAASGMSLGDPAVDGRLPLPVATPAPSSTRRPSAETSDLADHGSRLLCIATRLSGRQQARYPPLAYLPPKGPGSRVDIRKGGEEEIYHVSKSEIEAVHPVRERKQVPIRRGKSARGFKTFSREVGALFR